MKPTANTKEIKEFTEKVEGKNGVEKKSDIDVLKHFELLLEEQRNKIKLVNLKDEYIPNRFTHLQKYGNVDKVTNVFTSDVHDSVVEAIMSTNVDTIWKLLQLLGIGAFTKHTDTNYRQIMKKLANEQKLFFIIASTDYIYGTNYQFCHGYIGKDLGDMSQEKMIQRSEEHTSELQSPM